MTTGREEASDELRYAWEVLGTTGYDLDSNIVKYTYTYDDYKGLRTSMTATPGSGTGWG